ncbi:MAG: class I SAM-dependent methyltransferase [Desulfobacteraceae bacterium]|nr:MAG: class I SAM-dependent methyltransferase [Desulfobacteraceae bacterium]
MTDYHKYVFDQSERKFLGHFEEMYKAEKKGAFDSWRQDDLRLLDVNICRAILDQYIFTNVLDVGCGKGAFTQFLKKQNNDVLALDISSTAIERAKVRYPDIRFQQADVTQRDWLQIAGRGYDLVSCLELLSYVEDWRRLLKEFSQLGQFTLIKLFVPDNPIGYAKTMDALAHEFSTYFEIIEDIRMNNRKHIILFGRSVLGKP